jgi:hypothetical protein
VSPPPKVLLPLCASPAEDPAAWAEAEAQGAGTVAVINIDIVGLSPRGPFPTPVARAPLPRAAVPPTNTPRPTRVAQPRPGTPRMPARRTENPRPAPPRNAPPRTNSRWTTEPADAGRTGADGPDAEPWTALAEGIARLTGAGVQPLGHVTLGYATRPLVDVLGDIARWAVLPVVGIFLDNAPAGPFQVGPVVHSVRAARRAGLTTVVVNPGVPVDPIYRRLEATICTFEGSWGEYVEWTAEGTEPGDGHIVYGVPPYEWGVAWALIGARRAGLVLVTDRTTPYAVTEATATPST